MLLNAKRKTTPWATDIMMSFLQTWDEIMLLDSANLISEGDKLSHLYEIVQTCKDPEFRTQLAFYHEIATPDRTVELLYSRVETFLELYREIEQRAQQEKAIVSKIDASSSSRRGTPGKNQPAPKALAIPDKLKKQISDKDRQVSGLAAQLKTAGLKPDKRAESKERGRSESPKGKKGDGKGEKDKDRERSRSPETGKDMSHVVCYNCGKPGHYSRDCRSKKTARDSIPSGSSSNGSVSRLPKSEQPCHFHKPWAKPPKKCKHGDKCEYMHADERPKSKGTPGITHINWYAVIRWRSIMIGLLGNILPTQSFQIDADGGDKSPEDKTMCFVQNRYLSGPPEFGLKCTIDGSSGGVAEAWKRSCPCGRRIPWPKPCYCKRFCEEILLQIIRLDKESEATVQYEA